MKNEQTITRSAIRRPQAEQYILISLVAFAATVIVTRAFLELTGYPQIGNSVLHIAHVLWGGLLLIIAAYLPLAYANRWALQLSAILGGIGIGLFIDEVGKFITQANDYFFPPALPLIYGFILLNVLVYLYFRRQPKENPRVAMYYVLEELQDLLDGDLDSAEAARIDVHLSIAQQSSRPEITSLANTISDFLKNEKCNLAAEKIGLRRRIIRSIDAFGLRYGRRKHRVIITVALLGWVILVAGYIAVAVWGADNLNPHVLQWRGLLIGIQFTVGIFSVVAALFWLRKNEGLGLKFGVSSFLISLVALQLLYFYISQFAAITATLLQLAILQVLFAYRRWYLSDLSKKKSNLRTP